MILRFFNNFISFFVRISAFISKEFFYVASQPRLLGILILGPFLILLLFGISYQNTFLTLRTAIVVPEEKDIEAYVNTFAKQQIPNIKIVDVTTEKTLTLFDLQSRRLDLVMVVPPDITENMENNQQSVFTFYHQEIDPFNVSYVEIIVNRLKNRANKPYNVELFQLWTLTVRMDQTAELLCFDGPRNRIHRQYFDYTEFPLRRLELYAVQVEERILIMLPGEYGS